MDKQRVNYFKELEQSKEVQESELLTDVEYMSESVKDVRLPEKLFSYLLKTKRPDLLKYTPYKIKIYELDRGDNEWLQKCNAVAIEQDDGTVDYYVNPEIDHSGPKSLWLMFHEFRHKIQIQNSNVGSNVRNPSFEKWMEWAESNLADRNTLEHVLHEVQPFEIDCNTFACEMLGIDYVGSGFNITDERLRKLKRRKGKPIKRNKIFVLESKADEGKSFFVLAPDEDNAKYYFTAHTGRSEWPDHELKVIERGQVYELKK